MVMETLARSALSLARAVITLSKHSGGNESSVGIGNEDDMNQARAMWIGNG